ncbi:flagellin N-terminal helical domain-containing protein [Falsigemmobacter faecalis]|uniref:Flagellin n=1 Tax=Falsigemmobacter faecalis TaxID=2488730 RepID=A0A3P3DNF6_9RHOB|nr:flagellin [Falsigemmobacter faecalis]RRH75779.1 hypothetical protein EG244_07580 [Falsigemmobacter faecalis]
MTALTTLSTLQRSLSMRETVSRTDQALQKAQKEMTTGLRQDVYAETGFRAAQSLDMRNRMERIDSFAVNNQLLAGKISVMSDQLGHIRTSVQEFLANALSLSGGGEGAAAVAREAGALISAISTQLNTAYAGEFLFSGMATGSASVTGTGQLATLSTLPAGAGTAEITAERERLNAWYGLSGDPQDAPYTRTVFGGSTAGLQSAQIDEYSRLDYGVSANDPAIRQIFKGLSMFANTGYDGAASPLDRTAWIEDAMAALSGGVSGLQAHEAGLGNQQSLLEGATQRQKNLSTIYNNRVVEIEGVDGYEAATRFEQLSAQLEASYKVTVRLQSLSLLNFL